MIPDAQYRIIVLGPGSAQFGPRFKRRVRRRIQDLGENVLSQVVITRRGGAEALGSRMPQVAVYFGGADHAEADVELVGELLARSTVVIPVVEDLDSFQGHMPAALHPINGVALGASEPMDGLCNLVLENLGLLRKSRRLFISYRRTDSSTEALQIKHELDARGYDVFLDTHSVPKGDDFQEILWHRLSDSDVVVLLDTPGFMESRWTQEELAQTSAMMIGLVQVVWPGHEPIDYTDLCERVRLDEDAFAPGTGGGLTTAALGKVAARVEAVRARSLAARHDNLVREFCDAAGRSSVRAAVQPGRFIKATLTSGRAVAAIPAVGVLDASRYHEASRRFEETDDYEEIFLLYDGRGLRPVWGAFLRWLDDHLPVKAVRITQVEERLAK